jgi:hypothetical protein
MEFCRVRSREYQIFDGLRAWTQWLPLCLVSSRCLLCRRLQTYSQTVPMDPLQTTLFVTRPPLWQIEPERWLMPCTLTRSST